VSLFHKTLFYLAHEGFDSSFFHTYRQVVKNQYKPYKELKKQQDAKFCALIHYAYQNIPFYRNLLKNQMLNPSDFKSTEDLVKLPVLTKSAVKEHWKDLTPVHLSKRQYINGFTGGSTGTPLNYRLSKSDRSLGGALIYRGWGYAGYQPGDKMVFLAGSSLNVGEKTVFLPTIEEFFRNIRKCSSFDMSEINMVNYCAVINNFQPFYIRGYASSLYFFAKWIEDNGMDIVIPHAVFTTAEKLFPSMREKIQDVFQCPVYDHYGLNDGGLSAFECSEHAGLHIDTERSVLEVVDEQGNQIDKGVGRILATSLSNFAMPFIRYDTGDIGNITNDPCPCGRGSKLLKEVIGREQEILKTPEGTYIHGEFFSHIFWEIENVKEFQVIQHDLDHILINIVPEANFNKNQLEIITKYINKRSPQWNVEFKFPENLERSAGGKYKFIINTME
jgi:phenylacetate-CoA ligase